jgi:hypothetical protein
MVVPTLTLPTPLLGVGQTVTLDAEPYGGAYCVTGYTERGWTVRRLAPPSGDLVLVLFAEADGGTGFELKARSVRLALGRVVR